MLLTEEQAREKWCPLRKRGDVTENQWGSTIGRSGLQAQNCCIASGCAAWRWHEELNEESWNSAREAFEENADYEIPQRPAFQDSAEYQDWQTSKCGYCGLAGRAEHG